ncbi:hypothetical protein MSAN_00455700 [Mycena sanguinolenta]|uniref:C3H1-type domain-containing protein n=1 Tax=Mycena sanguinolenta TaxID=230812 RepID=A0A8H6ZG57_9AGAR|nr:hypothetical protein MSAN_00455700 [Mycena sanguinolenta]
MSTTSSPGDPEPEHEVIEDNGDAIVVLTPDTATLERALAERAAKRQAVVSKKRQTAKDKQAFGVTLMKIKNYVGAAACFAEACKLWRMNPIAHCDLATAYLHLGRFKDAEASASIALGLDPKLVEARYARAMARKGCGNARGAIIDLTTVLELAPDNASAQAALRDLEAERDAPPASTSTSEPTPPADSEGAAAPAASDGAAAASGEAAATAADPPSTDPPAPAPTEPVAGVADPDPEASYAHPLPTSPPLSHSALFDDDSASDTSDALHTGTGTGARTPCLFYNTSSCARGSACTFSHAPDRRSVRDGLGKNVCLYHLVGLCKFGPKCIYKHGREALGSGVGKAAAGTGVAEEGAPGAGAGANGDAERDPNDAKSGSGSKNTSRPKGKSKKVPRAEPHNPQVNALNVNANMLASLTAQHAALSAELQRRMALFQMNAGIGPYGGMPAGVGIPGQGQGVPSAGFTTEYVPPPARG